MEKLRQKLIPSNVVPDWLRFNQFVPGTYILLPTDDPEKTLVIYVMLDDL